MGCVSRTSGCCFRRAPPRRCWGVGSGWSCSAVKGGATQGACSLDDMRGLGQRGRAQREAGEKLQAPM